MAIIYSYPEKTTPADGDLLVITDSEQVAPKKNRTKSLSVGDLKTYVQTGLGSVSSVGVAMPAAFTVSGSPITTSGTITIGGAGTEAQYVDGTGELQIFSETVNDTIVRLLPFSTTASPGGSETLTTLKNIVKIGWSGGNGIYVVNLPSAATIPYRVIRFVTNGTYPGGGAHKVRFTATGGETIDGAAYFETSKVYEGIAIWSTGTEWVIIQAKAH